MILCLAGCGAPGASGAPPSSPDASVTPRARSWDECGSLALEFDPTTESHPGVLGVAVSPDRRTLVATTLLTAQAWRVADDLAASAHAWTVMGNEVYAEFSPDGSLVAISGDGRALVDFASGAEVFVPALPPSTVPDLEYPGAFMAFFDFSLDGRLVAGSGYGFAVEVFDTATHAPRGAALGQPRHGGGVLAGRHARRDRHPRALPHERLGGAFASNDDVFVGTNDGAVKRLCVRP